MGETGGGCHALRGGGTQAVAPAAAAQTNLEIQTAATAATDTARASIWGRGGWSREERLVGGRWGGDVRACAGVIG
jgi:hypothetical protein